MSSFTMPVQKALRHRAATELFVPRDVLPFREQRYSELLEDLRRQQKAELQTKESRPVRFQDPYFPNELYDKDFLWVSMLDLNPGAKFYSERVQPAGRWEYNLHKLLPGSFGPNWFYVALGQVAERKELLNWTMPDSAKQNACDVGIYRFRFWHAGVLREVVVDDLLPFNRSGAPVFVQSAYNAGEYWPGLLEKAYAKMHGSYHFLLDGHPEQAFADLTGGFPQAVRLNLATMLSPYILGRELKHWLARGSLVTAAVKFRTQPGELLDTDLVTGLPYTLLEQRDVRGRPLVKLRSPRGGHTFIHAEPGPMAGSCCGCLGGSVEDDGGVGADSFGHLRVSTFWMRYDEFLQNFHYLISVHLVQQLPNSRPLVWRYVPMPFPCAHKDRTVESEMQLNHVTGVFVQECNGWSDWERLPSQRQFGVTLDRDENKLLAHLVQESLPLKPPGDLCLLILQAEHGREHRVHDFRGNVCLRPMYDVQISQYGGCFSSSLPRGTYVVIPYVRVEGSRSEQFVPRRFSLRVAVTGLKPMRPLTDHTDTPWSTITRLSVSDFTFQIPAKREQLHELEFLQ
ncbi:hypothetical protein BOX15_Mlig025568g3 [Macrostomum lignano]|uniref:Calpain catalytic domain-containing protein n=1 Tax=Macrostomum lignano TaxID=282301 RepID=A0A267EAN6_9PLAT|nr:hypothetical protein BOX15_Mlig025568g3 [Macrostomum lignano]